MHDMHDSLPGYVALLESDHVYVGERSWVSAMCCEHTEYRSRIVKELRYLGI